MVLRKNVATLDVTDLTDPRSAFTAAYALSDDRGYAFYAGLHGLPLPIYCQHGTALFLPWHRAFLYFFERALTDAVRREREDHSLVVSLLWWDWTSATSHANGLPDAYLSAQNGADNPLAAGPVTLSASDLELCGLICPERSAMDRIQSRCETQMSPTRCPGHRPWRGRCVPTRSPTSPHCWKASTTECTDGSAGPCRQCRSPPSTRYSGHTTP